MRTIEGQSVLDAPEFHLLHLCNCVSQEAIGLTSQIFQKYPFADTYSQRPQRKSKPGTVEVLRSSLDWDDKRRVINLYGQRYPGKPTQHETAEMRERWFQEALDDLWHWIKISDVAVPWGIGMGMSGGDGVHYRRMLLDYEEDSKVDVFLYKP